MAVSWSHTPCQQESPAPQALPQLPQLARSHWRSKQTPEQEAETAGTKGRAFRMTCSEPEKESEKVDSLYEAFVRAKQDAGEETAKLSRNSFNEFVKKKTRDLQTQKNCREVEYVVEVVDGQVKLKALVKS